MIKLTYGIISFLSQAFRWAVFSWAAFRYFFIVSLLILFFGYHVWGQGMPEIGVELRADAEYKNSGDNNLAYANKPGVLFSLPRAHLNMNGNATDKFGYRLRLRWNQNFATQTDNTGLGLEYFYLKYQRNPALQIRFGKQRILQGGREGSYNPIDVLRPSRAGARIQGLHEVGLGFFYNPGIFNEELQNQALVGQIFNQSGGGHEAQTQLGLNIAWYSIIANGLLEPVVQYATIAHNVLKEKDSSTGTVVTTRSNYTESYLSIGTLLNLDDFGVDMDLLNYNQSSYETEDFSGNKSVVEAINETTFILFGRRIGIERSPFLKWIYELTSGGTYDGAANELQLGYEFYPIIESKDFKFHTLIAYRQETHVGNNFNVIVVNGGVSAQF